MAVTMIRTPVENVNHGFIMKWNHPYKYQIQLQTELSGAEFGFFYILTGSRKNGMP